MINPAPTPNAARILVIDDEASIRKVLSRLLKARGYDVLEANGDLATRDVIARGGYDLVISDLNIPNIDGLSVLRLVRAMDPDFP